MEEALLMVCLWILVHHGFKYKPHSSDDAVINDGGDDVKMRSLIIGIFLALVLLATSPARLLGLKGRERGQVDLLLRGSPH